MSGDLGQSAEHDAPYLGDVQRSVAKAGDERVRKGHARKDRRRWCRGKKGRDHTPAVLVPANGWRSECKVFSTWRTEEKTWLCGHRLICTTCGKVMEYTVPCPDRPAGMKQMWLKDEIATRVTPPEVGDPA